MIKAGKRVILTMQEGYDTVTVWPPKTVTTNALDE